MQMASVDIESVVVGKVTRRLFPFMIILTMVNFIDRVNIGFAALTMNKDLGIDPAVFGLAAGIFFSAMSFSRCRATFSCIGSGQTFGSRASCSPGARW